MDKKILLAVLLCCPIGLIAQAVEDSVVVKLSEVVIQSDWFESNTQDYAGSVSVLKPQTLGEANSLYLQPVLNTVPGVHMQSGALNTNRITIRGIGARSPFATNKIKAYLDEIPLSTGEGETTLEDVDFATLGGVEVYRGPASTLYGAGLGGAIHLRTQSPANSNKATLDYAIGSYGLKKYNLSLGVGNLDRGANVFYQKVSSEGYRDNNEYDRESITLIGKTKVASKSTLTSYFNATSLKAFIPSSLDSATYHNSPSSAETRWGNARGNEDNDRMRVGLSLKTAFNNHTESTLALFSNVGDSREVTPFGNQEVSTTNLGLRGKVRKELVGEKLTAVAGTELFFEKYRLKSFENNSSQNGALEGDLNQRRNYINAFLAMEYVPAPGWLVSAGGNLNFSTYKNTDERVAAGSANSVQQQQFDPIFSPKISVTRNLAENISVYGLVAHGFSLPTFDETLNPDGDINEAIKQEEGFNYEVGTKASVWEDKIQLAVSFYAMYINDLLVARRISELDYSGYNAGKSVHKGAEAYLHFAQVKTPGVQISHSMNITLMNYKFDEFVDDERGDFSGNAMTGVPNYTFGYQGRVSTRMGLYGVWGVQGVGKMPILDNNSVYSESYKVINLKVGYRRKISAFDLELYTGINNLLDEKYASMILINPTFGRRYYYPGLPVNCFGGVSLSYRF